MSIQLRRSSLVVGDLHLKPKNLPITEQLFNYIETDPKFKNIEVLNLLGDIYDTKAIIRSEAQNFLFDYLSKSRFKKINIITGNHDFENLECIKSALDPLKYIPKVRLYSGQELGYDEELQACFVPYIKNNDNFIKLLHNNIEKINKSQIIYCHQGFSGFDLGGGILDQHGVNINDLPDKLFIVGHYHKFQKNENILYLGTPYSHSFGEANQKKYILIVDQDLDFIETSQFLPQHYKIRYIAESKKLDIDLDEAMLKICDFIDVVVECKKSDQMIYSKEFVQKILGIEFQNLKIRYSFNDIDSVVKIDESISIQGMLEKYLQINKKNNLLDSGLEYLKNACI